MLYYVIYQVSFVKYMHYYLNICASYRYILMSYNSKKRVLSSLHYLTFWIPFRLPSSQNGIKYVFTVSNSRGLFFIISMTTFSVLVISSHRQILNVIRNPPNVHSKIHLTILKEPSPSLLQVYSLNCIIVPTKTILWFHWNFKFMDTSGLSESIVLLLPLYAYPPLRTRVTHPVLGPLVSVNALALNEHILAHIFVENIYINF